MNGMWKPQWWSNECTSVRIFPDFFEQKFFIPFGRFRTERRLNDSNIDTLVGREGHRAFLIDALSGAGRRGAYLVTGRRGVGKTTFVENCLSEYRANVFRRFLRSNVGRSPLDLIAVAAVGLFLLFVLLSASDLLEFLVHQKARNGSFLILVPLLLVLAVVLLPMILGTSILFRMWKSGVTSARKAGMVTTGTLIATVAFALHAPLTGAPVLFAVTASFVLMMMVLWAYLARYQKTPSTDSLWRSYHLTEFGVIFLAGTLFHVVFLTFAPFISEPGAPLAWSLFGYELPWLSELRPANSGNYGRSLLITGFLIIPTGMSALFFGLAMQSVAISIMIKKLRDTLAECEPTKDPVARKACDYFMLKEVKSTNRDELVAARFHADPGIFWRNAKRYGSLPILFAVGSFSYVIFMLVSGPPDVDLGRRALNVFLIVAGMLVMGALIAFRGIHAYTGMVWRPWWTSKANLLSHFAKRSEGFSDDPEADHDLRARGSNDKAFFCPPVEGLMMFKGILMILVSLQLAYPVISLLDGTSIPLREPLAICQDGRPEPLGEDPDKVYLRAPAPLLSRLVEQPGPSACAGSAGSLGTETAKLPLRDYFTVFTTATREEVFWFVIVSMLALALFIIEYEWISRPFIAQRQSGALDRGPRIDIQPRHSKDPTWLAEALAEDTAKMSLLNARKRVLKRQLADLKSGRRPVTSRQIEAVETKLEAIRLKRKTLKASLPASTTTCRAAQLDRISTFRLHETTTFPYLIVRVWLPALFVRVNLGFDRLDHRGVTHAMLLGLGKAYRSTFLSWRSPYHVIGRATLILLVMMLTVATGREFFDLPLRQMAIPEEDARSLGILVKHVPGGMPPTEDGTPGVPVGPQFDRVDTCAWLHHLDAEQGADFDGNGLNFMAEPFQPGGLLPKLGCDLNWSLSNRVFRVLYASVLRVSFEPALDPDVVPYRETRAFRLQQTAGADADQDIDPNTYVENPRRNRPVFLLAHVNNGLPQILTVPGTDERKIGQERSLNLRVYHIFLFGTIMWLLLFLLRRFPILPYENVQKEIDELTVALTQSQTERRKPGRFGLTWMIGEAFSAERETENQRDSLDPRSVELALMEILEDIQSLTQRRFFSSPMALSIPTPEVHFIFDEIDKIGGVVAADDTSSGIRDEEREAVDAERQRTYALHALLSDMKRVISSAPARFIFVGGRALHDEWVRDLNRTGTRQPLLSGIFDAELYLPSLLLDLPRSIYDNSEVYGDSAPYSRALNSRVREYFSNLHEAATRLNNSLRLSRLSPFYALPSEIPTEPGFVETGFSQIDPFESIQVIDWRRKRRMLSRANDLQPGDDDDKTWVLNDLIDFLAFRSAGSPKKLREIVSELIRPAGSFAKADTRERFRLFPDRDMLVIDAAELYRIQFAAGVFRHIDREFGGILTQRDDKVTMNVFFLFDYLMKLHG